MKKLKIFALVTLLCTLFALYSDNTYANDGGGDCVDAGGICDSGHRCCNGLVCTSMNAGSTSGTCNYKVGG